MGCASFCTPAARPARPAAALSRAKAELEKGAVRRDLPVGGMISIVSFSSNEL